MSATSLRQTLESLHHHLASIFTDDHSQRDTILSLMNEIDALLKGPDDALEAARAPLYQRFVDEGDAIADTPLERTQAVNTIRRIVAEDLSPARIHHAERRSALHALQDEMDAMPVITGDSQQALDSVRTEVTRELDPDQHDDPDTVRERLEDAIVHFEAEHPNLAAAMRRVVNILSQSGV